MKMHKLEVYVIDLEDDGIDSVVSNIRNNRHLCVLVQDSQTADIGDWGDNHVLNKAGTPVEVFRGYFGAELKNECS